jgi:DNA-binding LacI/PurR family transcriptional regulator
LHLLLFSGSSANLDAISDFVDGFICYGAPRNLVLIEQLARSPKRVLTVDFDLPGRPSVNIDNEQAAYESALAVLKPDDTVAILGLRLIDAPDSRPVLNAPIWDNQSSIAHRRLDGYVRAMSTCQLTLQPDYLWHIPESTQQHAQLAAKAVLALHPRPTALLCMSDLIALSAMREALQQGIAIPEQLRVIGFDGIDETLRYHPTLSSVWQFSDAKGQAAVHAFLSGADNPQLLPYELRLGESS